MTVTPARPVVSQRVHYVSDDGYRKECRAAIITEVQPRRAIDPSTGHETDSFVVGLCVLNPDGMHFSRSVVQMQNASHDGGTWHWPERSRWP